MFPTNSDGNKAFPSITRERSVNPQGARARRLVLAADCHYEWCSTGGAFGQVGQIALAREVGDGRRQRGSQVRDSARGRAHASLDAARGKPKVERETPSAIDVGVRPDVDIDLVEIERTEAAGAGTSATVARRCSVEEALELASLATAPRRSRGYHLFKRLYDVVVAVVALVVFSPVIALLAIVIRLDSRGSPFFRQTRVGRNGELFWFYKFRTMHVDARERFPDLYAYDYSDDDIANMFFKLPFDPRNTRVGKWLRRTSLDELPNLVNVLNGRMSLVGPRPEIPEMLPYYEPDQYCKFAVKPGVTGLAQVSGRNILRFVETNAHDVEYVETRSTRTDLRILFRTVGTVILMVGAH